MKKFNFFNLIIILILFFTVLNTISILALVIYVDDSIIPLVETKTEFTETEFYVENNISALSKDDVINLPNINSKDIVVMFNMKGCGACEREYEVINKYKDNLPFNLYFFDIQSSNVFFNDEVFRQYEGDYEKELEFINMFNQTNDFDKYVSVQSTPTYLIYRNYKWELTIGSGEFERIVLTYN